MNPYISLYESKHSNLKYDELDDDILSSDQKLFLDKNGYLIINNVFAEKECNEVLEFIFKDDLPLSLKNELGCRRINSLIYHNLNLFKKFVMNKTILAAVKHLSNNSYNFHLGGLSSRSVYPNHGEQNFHTDRLREEVPYSANIITVLSDFTENNGATMIIPESHINPNLTDELIVQVPKGSIIIMNIFLKHRGTKNNSNNIRHCLHGFYTIRNHIQTRTFRGLKNEDYNNLTDNEKYILDHDPEDIAYEQKQICLQNPFYIKDNEE
jgi:ectoine hydroxylase-related dioxygenase (phytanoyl-CoA dioxygenase family)